jgi:predicted transcriptional regulator
MPDDAKARVLMALESPSYRWRTLHGVAKEANLEPGAVLEAIRDLSRKGLVVRSSVPAANGEPLFTTRKHYRQNASLSERVLALLRNRGA